MRLAFVLEDGFEREVDINGQGGYVQLGTYPFKQKAEEIVRERKIYAPRPFTIVKLPLTGRTTMVQVVERPRIDYDPKLVIDQAQPRDMFCSPPPPKIHTVVYVRPDIEPFTPEEYEQQKKIAIGDLPEEYHAMAIALADTHGGNKAAKYNLQWEYLRWLRITSIELCRKFAPEKVPTFLWEDTNLLVWPSELAAIEEFWKKEEEVVKAFDAKYANMPGMILTDAEIEKRKKAVRQQPWPVEAKTVDDIMRGKIE